MQVHAATKTNTESKQRHPCRLDWAQSSWTRWIQVALWSWVRPILSLGNHRVLVDDDLDELSPNDTCSASLGKLHHGDEEWPGTWKIIKRSFLTDAVISGAILFLNVGPRIAQPLLLREIIRYLSSEPAQPAYVGYLSAIGLGACSALQAVIHQQVFYRSSRVGMHVRHALSSAIYKRLLAIDTASLHNTTAAQTINLVANDAGKFEELSIYLHYLWEAPLEAALVFGLIWWRIGVPTLFGYAVLVLLVPLQLLFSRRFGQYRKTTMACTDKRVQMFNELVNGCHIIKMYNWEKAMEQRVHDTRQRELASIFKASRLRALNMGLSFASLPLIALATFGGSWLLRQPLQAADIFTVLSFFGMVRTPVTTFLPIGIEKLSEARVAAKRIDAFMRLKRLSTTQEKVKNEQHDSVLSMQDASFSWNESPCLLTLNLQIKRGTFVGVKGAVGAGKSSLLAAILGEMHLVSGQLRRHFDSVSYAPQVPWIFADTIRANVLLGKPMDERRYTNVIRSCCLDVDLRNFGGAGDLMVIGDKGVNLSGGQRARISLARALYADADLYLLDDPLAAVDPEVAKKIFHRCIGPRSLLNGKTRLLVTHQTHFLAQADQRILLQQGQIADFEPEETYANESTETIEDIDVTDVDWMAREGKGDLHAIVKSETSLDGAVNWNVWRRLFVSSSLSWFGLLALVLIMLIGEGLYDATNRWLGLWSAKPYDQQRSPSDAYVYLGLTLGTLVAALARASYFFYVILRGSNFLHNRMLSGVLYTSVRFFESNPSGRILNRASKDQQVLDELLPTTLVDAIQALLMTFGSLVIIGIVNPWVLLVLVPIVPTFWWLRRYYLRSSRQLKRLESVTRSPIYALFSSSLDGLTTIRAFNVENDFVNMFLERNDTNTRAFFTLTAAVRWFGLRLDLMTSLLALVTAILSVALHGRINPSAAALSLSYCINLTMLFQWAIRQSAEVENLMTSAERIHEYGQLVPEQGTSKDDVLVQPPSEWPARGVIEFKDYTFRYRAELEPVLKNISLRIQSKEKIGIIGRTGAGKSSLLQALFRFVDKSAVNGIILIDGIDISHLSLDHLRSHLSVIPQVPVLFCATLRYNLDPFEQFSDEQCLMALEAVQLKQLVCGHAEGLSLPVAESGSNLSAGECQLICVARAILKKSKILLIDEATANVDHATDKMIQEVIAEKFRDRTILTIAHRFNTIADSDRILVLQNGEVAYFDVPLDLNLSQYDRPLITYF